MSLTVFTATALKHHPEIRGQLAGERVRIRSRRPSGWLLETPGSFTQNQEEAHLFDFSKLPEALITDPNLTIHLHNDDISLFGLPLKKARKARGMSQLELGQKAGLHGHTFISNLERGRGKFTERSLVAIAEALNCDVKIVLIDRETGHEIA